MSKENILVIGASSSIGCEIIRQIADEETVILAHYHQAIDKLSALQTEVKGKIIPMQADLSLESGIDSLIDSVRKSCDFPGKIIFLAAPQLVLTRFKDLKWADFRSQIDMQLYTAYKILNEFIPQMALARHGRVVFMLSNYTLGLPPASMAHYVTAKYALLGFMKCLSAEYAGKKICINAVSPSMIETAYLSQIPEKIIEITANQHPLKRNGLPRDVAPVVKFLLSEEAGYITGVNIPITGGS